MKKVLLIMWILLSTICTAFGQLVRINLKPEITLKDTKSIKLYRFNSQKECGQEKNMSIIFNNKISPCFEYIKTFNNDDMKLLVNILRSKKSYCIDRKSCFDTNYSLLFLDKENTVTAFVNISFNCDRLYSYPNIQELKSYSPNDLTVVGFTSYSRNLLRKLFNVPKGTYNPYWK